MRVCERFVRALVLTAGMCCLVAGIASGQTVSPSSLTFAVPGTVSAASASQEVSISVSSPLAISLSFGGTNPGSFSETDTCSSQPTVAPPGCVVDITFTAPPNSAGTLETATLNVNNSPVVNLSGSLGAILLFKPVDIGTSNGNVSLTQLVTFNSTTLALSCPGGSTQKLSSTPDGSGFVMVDNFLTVQLGANPPKQTTVNGLIGNVCPGNLGNPMDSGQPDCFTSAYQGAAAPGAAAFGKNPDTFANPNNTILSGPGGVSPIDVTSNFANGGTTPTVTFNMLDGGGEVGSTSLFLVSACTPQAVAPGGTVTGNPVNPQDPSTLSQASIFNSTNGQSISITTDVSNSPASVPAGTQQVTTDFGIPQSLFNQLVAGTSAAPAVCLRLSGELDANGNALCKGYLIQCWDPGHHTLTGDNCITTPSAARNLFDATKFDSHDAPPGQNYLTAAASDGHGIVSACAGVATSCAQVVIGSDAPSTMLVGPGILLGGDQWLCSTTSGTPPSVTCTNQQLDTSTTAGNNYTASNCVLTGTLGGDLCPLDTLTQFKGAADPVHGSTTTGKNSIFIPVVNVPLPFTQTTVTGRTTNGWVNNPSVMASFTSNQANYNPASGNPSANTFVPAPPYSVTYGFAPAANPAPDTTFPVPGDLTLYNAQTFPNFAKPLCTIPGGTPGSFTPPAVSFTAGAQSIYNLHYFTTDCALTEELLFQPTPGQLTDASANWASFRTVAFGVDTSAPSLSCGAPTPNGTNGWYKTVPTVACSATDAPTAPTTIYSGFATTTLTTLPNPGCDPAANPDCAVKQGSLTTTTSGTPSGSGASAVISVTPVQDLAGNMSNTQGPYPTPLDNTAPTFSATFNVSGTTFTVGQNVTAKFTCGDTGSGLATCGTQTIAACPLASASGLLSSTNMTGLPIDTSAAAVGMTHTLNAVDCAGNPSATSVSYTVVYPSAELAIANIPNPLLSIKSGNNLTYKIFVLNLSANTASNIVVTDTLPANTSYVSAISGIVSCTLVGCNDLTTGSMCTPSGNTVTCTTPTVKPILPGLTGFVIKLVVKVTAPASVKSITDTATVTSSNPDPIKGDNTVTVTTKVTQ